MFRRSVLKVAAKIYHFSQYRIIPVKKILRGGENGLSGIQLSRHTGNLMRTSESIEKIPQFELISDYLQYKEDIFLSDFFSKTNYYKNAVECINLFGRYFSATKENEILAIARSFLKNIDPNLESNRLPNSDFFSTDKSVPVVYPIKYSDCYQLHDGNHRLAIALHKKQSHIKVRVVNKPQLTSLQQMLLDVGWNINKRDLYQPLLSPELSDKHWKRVRKCIDRRDLMLNYIKPDHLNRKENVTYIDLACNFGWFVKTMQDQGFDAYGLEIDLPSREIAKKVLRVDGGKLLHGNVLDFVEKNYTKYDYVSCFSFAHHILIRSSESEFKRFITNLSGITNKVLFFEMGDCDEEWFKNSLRGWNKEKIQNWLVNSNLFSNVVFLGLDKDRGGNFKGNYNRALFACVK